MRTPCKNTYLDYNASAPLRFSVREMIKNSLDKDYGNPSSIHDHGQKAKKVIEEARDALQAPGFNVFFTSGATEANNWILRNFKGSVIVSEAEHDSVFLARQDANVCRILPSGILDLNHLKDLIKQTSGPTLVSVMVAHNESGIIQPLKDIIDLCRTQGAFIHTDAVQGIGRVDFDWTTCDAFSISGHKLGGVMGIGGLFVRKSFPLSAWFLGGGQEKSFRSGTENVIGIMSLKMAFEEATKENWEPARKQRDAFESKLLARCPFVEIIGKREERLPNTSYIFTPDLLGETQVIRLDLEGFSLSSGSACSSGKVKESRTLKAMGYKSNAIRISFGANLVDLGPFLQTFETFLTQRHMRSL